MDPRRDLPSVERVLGALDDELPHPTRALLAREAIEHARQRIAVGATPSVDDVLDDARTRARSWSLARLGPVINATGVLLHTNLARAPLDDETMAAMRDAAGYANLEYRLEGGVRGSRHEHAGSLLAEATGAEAGMVVNNNAAAVLLVLATLARGRDVVVSRGELVEIGGGFRIPDILAETGARLVEVGTTNRTRASDYDRACDEHTALILQVHASNYRMIGFVESTPVRELAAVGPPVVVDIGSGLLDETTPWLEHRPAWLQGEPGVRQCLASGAALVTFSGDKLLGGPQAGVIVGRRDLIERCMAQPLARAVRAGKTTLAGLQHVALAYLSGRAVSLPLWAMATAPVVALRERAEWIASHVVDAEVVATEAVAGGGSVPGREIPSIGVALRGANPDTIAQRLRAVRVVARVENDRVVCDLRTVAPEQDGELLSALLRATS